MGRFFETSCANGHENTVCHARCWHANCAESDDEDVYNRLLGKLEVETSAVGPGEDAAADGSVSGGVSGCKRGSKSVSQSAADSVTQPPPPTQLKKTFKLTEEPAVTTRFRACAMWVTKTPCCPVPGCGGEITRSRYFSDCDETHGSGSGSASKQSESNAPGSTNQQGSNGYRADAMLWTENFQTEIRRSFRYVLCFPNPALTVCPYIAIYSYQKGRLTSVLTVCPYIAIYNTDTFPSQSQVFLVLLFRNPRRL